MNNFKKYDNISNRQLTAFFLKNLSQNEVTGPYPNPERQQKLECFKSPKIISKKWSISTLDVTVNSYMTQDNRSPSRKPESAGVAAELNWVW